MPEQHKTTILRALSHSRDHSGLTWDRLTVTRQGGMTNLVFRVDAEGCPPVIVRVPGVGTEDYIDRVAELTNARAAARAGVSPEILYGNPDAGLLVMTCIENVVTMTPDNFARIKGSPSRAGAALRQLHRSGEEFAGRFELFSMIEDYLGVLGRKRKVRLPSGYHDVVASAQPIKAALAAHPAALAPCHCDPLCENFLDDGDRMWVVDYEYGGMNDPLWDLGDLSVEGHFTEEMETEMLCAYFGRPPTAAERGRVVVYKAMCDLLWTLWGLIQFADGNTAEDFWDYATTRFERCKALMDTPSFGAHVAALRG